MVGGGDLFYVKFGVNPTPVGANSPIFNRYSPVGKGKGKIKVNVDLYSASSWTHL